VYIYFIFYINIKAVPTVVVAVVTIHVDVVVPTKYIILSRQARCVIYNIYYTKRGDGDVYTSHFVLMSTPGRVRRGAYYNIKYSVSVYYYMYVARIYEQTRKVFTHSCSVTVYSSLSSLSPPPHVYTQYNDKSNSPSQPYRDGGKSRDDGKKTNSGSRAIETIYTRDVVYIARHRYTVQYNNYMHKQ